jgi:hypothetical protein
MSLFGKSKAEREIELRAGYLAALAGAIQRGMDASKAHAHAKAVTAYNYVDIPEAREFDFYELYKCLRSGMSIKDAFNVASELIEFRGPIAEGRTPPEIYEYVVGGGEGPPANSTKLNELDLARIKYLTDFAYHFCQSGDYGESRSVASAESRYPFTPSTDENEKRRDFATLYLTLTRFGSSFRTAVITAFEISRYGGPWDHPMIPPEVRELASPVLVDHFSGKAWESDFD